MSFSEIKRITYARSSLRYTTENMLYVKENPYPQNIIQLYIAIELEFVKFEFLYTPQWALKR